jgi:hypothetical protein
MPHCEGQKIGMPVFCHLCCESAAYYGSTSIPHAKSAAPTAAAAIARHIVLMISRQVIFLLFSKTGTLGQRKPLPEWSRKASLICT